MSTTTHEPVCAACMLTGGDHPTGVPPLAMMLTVTEAAAYLRADPRTIHRALADGDIPSIRVGHSTIRIPTIPFLRDVLGLTTDLARLLGHEPGRDQAGTQGTPRHPTDAPPDTCRTARTEEDPRGPHTRHTAANVVAIHS